LKLGIKTNLLHSDPTLKT